MLRTQIPFSTWLEQPDGVIETAIRLLNEQDDIDSRDDHGPGPQMSG